MTIKYLIYATLLFASCATAKDAADTVRGGSMETNNSTVVIQGNKKSMTIKRYNTPNGFAFSLFEYICDNDTQENICISPASAECALAMVANGAKERTLEQILSTLGSESLDSLNKKENFKQQLEESETILTSANSIWVNEKQSVKQQFIADNKKYHNAFVSNVPFNESTANIINDWCSKNTNGKISNIVDNLDNSTRLLLINALYLKGAWKEEFNKNATTDESFTKADETVTTVKMMHQTLTTSYNLDENIRMVSMPIKNSNINVWFILPRRGMSMSEAAAHLATNYDTLRKGVNPRQRVNLSLPRFKTEYRTSLKESLTALGMSDAFGSSANLKGISDAPLYIDDVLQKTYLRIDEKGAEAAAVTSVMVGLLSMRPTSEPIELKFDRPFLYMITDTQTDNILFIGKVGNPTE